jgi:RimJ/RimL family protein N-acetyltransferase
MVSSCLCKMEMINGVQLAEGQGGPPLPGLVLRAIGPGDRERVAAMHARLSLESRVRRFFTAKPRLTARELTFLTDVDHRRHEALAAVDPRDGSIVGTARYVQEPGRLGVADVAIEVVDELQNRGIGTALASALLDRARENGFRLLTATTLWENRPARALLRQLRFHARESHGGQIEFELVLDGRRRTGGPE